MDIQIRSISFLVMYALKTKDQKRIPSRRAGLGQFCNLWLINQGKVKCFACLLMASAVHFPAQKNRALTVTFRPSQTVFVVACWPRSPEFNSRLTGIFHFLNDPMT